MLGPHFYYDVIRLARKGWPTWLRVLYLGSLLISLAIIHETQPQTVGYTELADQAHRAQGYAYTIIALQDVLLLLLLPVYVAGAIAHEKESQTIDLLFLTHLSDREIVLGKLGARLAPVAALLLSAMPLLAFFYLSGNVPADFLVYHEANVVLLMLCGGTICIWTSTQSQSVFEAVTNSYGLMLVLGLFGVIGAMAGPWISAAVTGKLSPRYDACALIGLPCYLAITWRLMHRSIANLERYRREQRRKPRRLSGALTLTDRREPPRPVQRKHRARSYIHPSARIISNNALFWKECLKDGTSWSLSGWWILVGIALVVVAGLVLRVVISLGSMNQQRELFTLAAAWAYTAYFIAGLTYVLLVLFQTTMSVAGEREQDTLSFLLLTPYERPIILFHKWLGPLWRNWPVLAIAYLGVLLGFAAGAFSLPTALVLLLGPWPLLLMLCGLALWLSVSCRRVLYANIGLVAFLALLVIIHVAAAAWLSNVLVFYASILFQANFADVAPIPWQQSLWLAVAEQTMFLLLALACGTLALRRFRMAY